MSKSAWVSSQKASAEVRDARAGVIEQQPVKPKNQQPDKKPFVLEYRYLRTKKNSWMNSLYANSKDKNKWHKWNRYATYEEAQKVMGMQVRKHPELWEFRIVGNQ